MKQIIRDLVPPIIWRSLKKIYLLLTSKKNSILSDIEWEYMPQGWLSEKIDPNIKGWNEETILEAYKANWQVFLSNLEGTSPFGISPESDSNQRNNLIFHNIMMTYAYALTLAARHQNFMSMLDWGGGIGHYYLISKKLVPEINIDYHCKDVPVLTKYGKEVFPEASFYTDESCLQKKYDFVLASTSLQYSQDWGRTLKGLAKSTIGYLFITRLPIVQNEDSFVIVQRPYRYGYNTEYLGWCLNRQEFLNVALAHQLQLIREFVVEPLPPIYKAPEQPEHWGFLFKKLIVNYE